MGKKILIIEDNKLDVAFLCDVLAQEGFSLAVADQGSEGINLLPIVEPDLVILDLLLPDIDGYEVCRRIRTQEKYAEIPILFYTNSDGIDEKLIGMEIGASDFLAKHHNRQELVLRIRCLLRNKETLDYYTQLSFFDAVTEIYNRRYFEQRLYEEMKRSIRYRRSFTCALFDVDNFKQINDSYGHVIGDLVLRRVAAMLRDHVTASDVVCRYGGDEFVVLFPELTLTDARSMVERMRQCIQIAEIHTEKSVVRTTVSCGLSGYDSDAKSGTDIIAHADTALYEAKNQGKNCIRWHLSETVPQN